MINYHLRIALVLLLAGISAKAQQLPVREKLSLAGSWMLKTDPSARGLQEHWQDSSFVEEVLLPGTLEENGKGEKVGNRTTDHLNQTYTYTGAAWFQRDVVIPRSWANREVTLFVERTKASRIWVDGRYVGQCSRLSVPHRYRLKGLLSPGPHRLTIRIDNSPALFPVGGSHALSEHTQTNWNGMIGELYLEALPDTRIESVRVIPDAARKLARVRISLQGNLPEAGSLVIGLKAANDAEQEDFPEMQIELQPDMHDSLPEFAYPLAEQVRPWSEYSPALYELIVKLYTGSRMLDTDTVPFGLKTFKAEGSRFSVNGNTTFLRGKNDCCIFPLTGYPPMNTEAWQRLFRKAKSYGINHYRFHSWTPPEAAFDAADREGIYIQAELPDWSALTEKDTFRTRFQLQEGLAILDTYGNHPSFVLFTLGNELTGDSAVHNRLVAQFRQHDARRLYAYGTNAFYTDPAPGVHDDFWVTMRTGGETAGGRFDLRGSFATTEDRTGGILNATRPGSRRNFSSALAGVAMPAIGHETGQYQIYPDYSEIPRYTGVLRPSNLEVFRQRLTDAGMGDQAEAFFKASGKLAALLYREEVEMALRTPGMAGFQLLDLQDFPGQGTALVGLLNAFMESKGLISEETFRSFCNDRVLQLQMDRYTWTADETFSADVNLVNYSPRDLKDKQIRWSVLDEESGRSLQNGLLPVAPASKGQINALGKIAFPLTPFSKKAVRLTIRLEIPGEGLKTEYPVWVYPEQVDLTAPKGVHVASGLDEETIRALERGAKVLLFPRHDRLRDHSVGGQFISEFWNWKVFKKGAENMNRPVSAGTLGILTDPANPLFGAFPTEFHTNWQWWPFVKNARPLILDRTAHGYRPLVQVIDNIDRNHKLGLIFECKAGKGKLLVCMARLPALTEYPEARQLYFSMLRYMDSPAFDPSETLDIAELKALFNEPE
ncbi:MAG: sugar-binding domain-containing protein [Mangrovibacterium sp.]